MPRMAWGGWKLVNSARSSGSSTPVVVTGGAGAQINQAVFQQGDNVQTSNVLGTVWKIEPPNNLGSGNRLVLQLSYLNAAGGGAAISTISDTVNGSWSTTPVVQAAGATVNSDVYEFLNSGSGLTIITIKFAANNYGPSITFLEISGTSTTVLQAGTTQNADQTYNGSTPISCGSLVPSNNDSTGGNLLLAFFCFSNGWQASSCPTTWTPTSPFSLLNADISPIGTGFAGLPKASQSYLQTAHASITPQISPTGDTTDTFHGIALAIPAALGAGTQPASFRLHAIHSMFTFGCPASWVMQCPTIGNCRAVASSAGGQFTGVTDSNGNTFTFVTADSSTAGAGQCAEIFYVPNTSGNSSLKITAAVSAGNQGVPAHCYLYDIVGAATSSVIGANGFTTNGGNSNNSSVNDIPDITPTQSGSLVLICAPNGVGPTTGVTAPSNVISDMIQSNNGVSGQGTDQNAYNTGDGFAHFYTTSGQVGFSQAIDWTYLSGVTGGVGDGHAVEFLHP